MRRAVAVLLLCGLGFAPLAAFQGTPAAPKARTLPVGATETSSNASVVPGFMILLDEGGVVPSEIKSTCDNLPTGNSKSTVGIHLEHYLPDAKMVFDQKVAVAKLTTTKDLALGEAGSMPIVVEVIDGADAAYFVTKGPCIQDTNPASNKIDFFVRLMRGTTFADIRVSLFAANPEAARKYVREVLAKVGTLDYSTIK